eukprot:9545148-Karenia_brevis.AAC.1
MYEVPCSMPYLIESTCMQNATPHMLAEEVQRMCTMNPHLQTGGTDPEIRNKICPAVPCVISCQNLQGIAKCGSDNDKQAAILSQIDE